jgi:hypothetical protein
MIRSSWSWLWFLLAVLLVLATVACGVEVLAASMTRGDTIGSLSPFTGLDQQWWMRGIELRRKTVDAEAICLLLACICLGTGLRTKFRWSIADAYVAAFVICPLSAVAICVAAFLAISDLFHSR